MEFTKVIVDEMEHNRIAMIFDLFGEGIRKTGKAPHVHPHRQILALHMGCADELAIRPAEYCLLLG